MVVESDNPSSLNANGADGMVSVNAHLSSLFLSLSLKNLLTARYYPSAETAAVDKMDSQEDILELRTHSINLSLPRALITEGGS